MRKRETLYHKALGTELTSRFQARAADFNRQLTDEETAAEARYQLEDLPYKPEAQDDPKWAKLCERQMKRLIKEYEKRTA